MLIGEERAIDGVAEAMSAAFPGLLRSEVRACVDRVLAEFADAKIRTYLPILVARRVRLLLTQATLVPEPRTAESVAAEMPPGARPPDRRVQGHDGAVLNLREDIDQRLQSPFAGSLRDWSTAVMGGTAPAGGIGG